MESPPNADSASLQGPVIAAALSSTLLAALAVGLRLFTRGILRHLLGKDDWTIVASFVCSVVMAIFTIRQTSYGSGRHIWTLTPDQIKKSMKAAWVSSLFYALSLTCTKLSILFLYMRIFAQGMPRVLNWAVFAIVAISGVWVVISLSITCIPLEAFWDGTVPGRCLPLAVNYLNAGLHIATDYLILLLPFPSLLKLKMDSRQKFGLLAAFAVGFFVCLISIIRLSVLIRLLASEDPTFDSVSIANWSSVEVNLGIICACLTTLKPLASTVSRNVSSLRYPRQLFASSYSDGDISSSRRNRINRLTDEIGLAVGTMGLEMRSLDRRSTEEKGSVLATESGIGFIAQEK